MTLIKEFANWSHDPRTWGPKLWLILHTLSLNIINDEDKSNFIDLLQCLKLFIPCVECKKHYNDFLKNIDLKNNSITELQSLLFDLHNEVNKRTSKKDKKKSILENYKTINKDIIKNAIVYILFCISFNTPSSAPEFNDEIINMKTYDKRIEFINKVANKKTQNRLRELYGEKLLYELNVLDVNERKEKLEKMIDMENEKENTNLLLIRKYKWFYTTTVLNEDYDTYMKNIFWNNDTTDSIQLFLTSIINLSKNIFDISIKIDNLNSINNKSNLITMSWEIGRKLIENITYSKLLENIDDNLIFDLYEMHTLTCKRDLFMSAIMIESFRKYVSKDMWIYVHYDPSLTKKEVYDALISFGRVILVEETQIDDIKKKLKKYPECYKYRFTLNQNKNKWDPMKLFDLHLVGKRKRTLYIDPDILFFKKPVEIIENLRINQPFYLGDYQNSYIKQITDNKLEKANAGLYMVQKDYLDLDYIENLLVKTKVHYMNALFWREQTIFSCLFLKAYPNGKRLSNNYSIGPVKTNNKIDENTVANHFVNNGSKHLFYDYAKKILNKQQINKLYSQYAISMLNNLKTDIDITIELSKLVEIYMNKWYWNININNEMLNKRKNRTIIYSIKEGNIYKSGNDTFTNRSKSTENIILEIFSNIIKNNSQLAPFDIAINYHDYPLNQLVLSFSCSSRATDLMYPNWSFIGGGPCTKLYPTGIGNWKKFIDNKYDIKWENKINKLFFRGSRTNSSRDNLILTAEKNIENFDVGYTSSQSLKVMKNTKNIVDEISLEDHEKWKYLINVDGVTSSFRLRHLFLTKSLVLKQETDYNEYFYPLIKPWYDYIPLRNDLQDLEYAAHFCKNNDEISKNIGLAGERKIRNILSWDNIVTYWTNLIYSHIAFQTWETDISQDAKILSKVSNNKNTNKTLIYFTIFNNADYINLLDMLLITLSKIGNYKDELLFITSKDFKHRILNLDIVKKFSKINWFILEDHSDVFNASFNKLKICDWEYINNYDQVLYLDSDILILNDISPIWNRILLQPNVLHMSQERSTLLMSHSAFSGNLFTDNELRYIEKNKIRGLNGGLFGFKPSFSTIDIFKNILDLASKDKTHYCLEQPAINKYLFKTGASTSYFTNWVSHFGYYIKEINNFNKILLHFPGGAGNYKVKREKMFNIFQKLKLC